MSYALDPGKPIRRGLKQLARHQLRRADTCLRADGERSVHEARKSVKKVRAIVTMLRQAGSGGLGRDERRLRAAGRVLSTLRDSDAVIATFDHLRRRFPKRLPEHTYAAIRRRLVQARTHTVEEALDDRRLARAARTLRAVRRSAKAWRVPVVDPLDLPDLLKASYRASRQAMHRAQKTSRSSDSHRWRRRVKSFWYQLRLMQSLAPGLRSEIQRLEQLETWLGDHQNLSVLQAAIASDTEMRSRFPGAPAAVIMMSRSLQEALRRKALALGRRLLTGRPKAFARDLRRALSASRRKRKRTSARREPGSSAA